MNAVAKDQLAALTRFAAGEAAAEDVLWCINAGLVRPAADLALEDAVTTILSGELSQILALLVLTVAGRSALQRVCSHDFRASDVCAKCEAKRPFYAVCPHGQKGLQARACRRCRGFDDSTPKSTASFTPDPNAAEAGRLVGRARWSPDAMTPKRVTLAHDDKCRRCGKELHAGDEAQSVPFAVGGMKACTGCTFWAPGEQR